MMPNPQQQQAPATKSLDEFEDLEAYIGKFESKLNKTLNKL